MEVVGDLVARERRSDRTALSAPAAGRSYSWHDLCTDSYRAGNVLRFLGVREGVTVAVAPVESPDVVLAFLGAAQLGAVTRFGTAGYRDGNDHGHGDGDDGDDETPLRVLLVPVDREDEFDPPPGSKLAVHGGSPTDPATTHWEQELWSENPVVQPATVGPETPALSSGTGRETATYTHADLLSAAVGIVDDLTLDATDALALRGPLTHPGIVAGLLAALTAGGRVVLGPDEEPADAAVGSDVPEARSIDPDAAIGSRPSG
jgi:acyl-CoA synthetase (AMP-forming)/AMP-acid ligase II